MTPIEITGEAIEFHGVTGLVLLGVALLIILFLFHGFVSMMAGKRHRNDWIIKLLFWGGAIAIILSVLGLTPGG